MSDCIPAKWKKISILAEFGLRELSEIEASIHRFTATDSCGLANQCKEYIDRGINSILIAVPITYERVLPNFHINTEIDLQAFFNDQYTKISKEYAEIWCCPQSKNSKKFFARVMILDRRNIESALMEVVYAPSARRIDKYDGIDDYICQNIDILMGTAENKAVISYQCSKAQLVRVARMIREYLSNKYLDIVRFARRIDMIGEKALCLEIVFEDYSCSIIDFDTSDDERVIHKLWRK